ncbi:discoidin domain-containing protein, partial [Streptococcus oralis]|uniref:discoidin domain-containing protein n=1 Tax=Streptococcus oralis TaxID=1303 RepID=UPI00210E4B04
PETSPASPKPAETPKPVETPKAENRPAETTTQAVKPAEKTIEDREDVNHLEGATAQASNHETGTHFTADKAIDGDDNTRWATDRDAVKPTFELTLPKTTLIKHVEID